MRPLRRWTCEVQFVFHPLFSVESEMFCLLWKKYIFWATACLIVHNINAFIKEMGFYLCHLHPCPHLFPATLSRFCWQTQFAMKERNVSFDHVSRRGGNISRAHAFLFLQCFFFFFSDSVLIPLFPFSFKTSRFPPVCSPREATCSPSDAVPGRMKQQH